MTDVVQSEIRSGAYADSIVLMQLQSALTRLPGVIDAGVVMGTPVNLDLLASNDLLPESAAAAGADDLVVVVKAENDEAAADALAQIDSLLAQRSRGGDREHRPLSLGAAVKVLPDSNWVLVSVPGRWAAGVAREAVDLGRHVFLYSDNVPLEEEIQLKQEAAREVASMQKLSQEMVESIFSFGELGFQEFWTVEYITGVLEAEGFEVETGCAGMPTCYVASWGSGKPVIGFMGDIDGLPETSQRPGVAYHDPLIEGGGQESDRATGGVAQQRDAVGVDRGKIASEGLSLAPGDYINVGIPQDDFRQCRGVVGSDDRHYIGVDLFADPRDFGSAGGLDR